MISFFACKKADESIIQTSPSKEHASKISEIEITIAQKIAVLDTNSEIVIDVNDPRVIEIQKHLSSLSNTFNESENKISNTTFIIHQKFKEEGLNYSISDLLIIADKNNKEYKESGIHFDEYMALIYTLTSK